MSEPQPYFIVKLENGERILVNEYHVSTIRPSHDGYAELKMSNGDILIVADPPYSDWENDYHRRKW